MIAVNAAQVQKVGDRLHYLVRRPAKNLWSILTHYSDNDPFLKIQAIRKSKRRKL